MTSITLKKLVPRKRLEIHVVLMLIIVVISSELSSSMPVESNHDRFVLTTDQGGARDMSCLKDNTTYLFDLESRKCYSAESRGPCNRNMRFNRVFIDKKKPNQTLDRIGECDCNPHAVLPLVYHIKTDQCYPLFKQSYCPNDQWLLYLKNGTDPVCEPNPCLSEQSLDPKKNMVLLYGQCVALGANCDPPVPSKSTSGLPPLSSKSIGQFSVRFQGVDVYPTCSHPGLDVNPYALGSMGVQSCRKGFKKDRQGRCRKTSLSVRSSDPTSKINNNDEVITFGDEDDMTDSS